jgi:hypothetical protein
VEKREETKEGADSMMKMMNKVKVFLLAAALTILPGFLPVQAKGSSLSASADPDAIEIWDGKDLQAIADQPDGTYIQMADIDMTGIDWTPLDFSGTYDGNGFSILNLNIDKVSENTAKTYDGNMKEYDSVFAGLFGILKDATVNRVRLVNETMDVTSSQSLFAGGIAGFMEDSTISNSSVQGRFKVTTDCKSFGVAGLLGFGNGTLDQNTVDVEMISEDTNVEYKEEQFMGGLVAVGYPTITNNTITINGYDMDHGYVHNGGIVGMFMIYPQNLYDLGNSGATVDGNTVNGQITFFEDNTDRRAYCDGFMGEVMSWGFDNGTNDVYNFTRNETFDYNAKLSPEADADPSYEETVVKGDCHDFGYTEHKCKNCGYTWRDAYTLKEHTVGSWSVVRAATAEKDGLESGSCSVCGQTVYRRIPRSVPAGTLKLDHESIQLKKGETGKFSVTSTDPDIDLSNGAFASANEGVVTISADGTVTAVANGKANITWTYGSTVLTGTVTVADFNLGKILLIILGILVILLVLLLIRASIIRRRKARRRAARRAARKKREAERAKHRHPIDL